MTNEELLIAISSMMDEKLDANLTPMKNDISELKNDMAAIKNKVSVLDTKVAALDAKVAALDNRVTALDAKVAVLDTKVAALDTKVVVLDTKVTKIQLDLESDIRPRLQNVEACYIDTYKRYLQDSERMETAFEDIVMLKTVVADHSEKLKYVS